MKKWFRVATQGATTDGRAISRAWIEQMAANFNREKYGARVWLEHMRGMFADGPFKAFGDVTAVKAEENDAGKLELFAEIDPTEDLVKMTKDRQKIYTSIEVDPKFSDTGEAYLVGLAVTDSPASLGTEMLQFSSRAKNSPLNARKQRAENLFSEAVEAELDFSEAVSDQGSGDQGGESMLTKVKPCSANTATPRPPASRISGPIWRKPWSCSCPKASICAALWTESSTSTHS